MERRLTLISDPTDEFPHNKNNRFKVRISNGLRLEGKGWKITLLSLTLPNSDAEKLPFVSGASNGVARSCWKILHLKGPPNRPLNQITAYSVTSVILDSHVANAPNGVAYWNSMIQAMETQVISNTYSQSRLLIDASDPARVVFVKESMCPSFRWEGEDLIIKRLVQIRPMAVQRQIPSTVVLTLRTKWPFNGDLFSSNMMVMLYRDPIYTCDYFKM